MQQKKLYSRMQLALAICMCSLPATASVLFTDLGTTGNIYNDSSGWTVAGSGFLGTSETAASMFTVAGSGSESVMEIDLAVAEVNAPNTFNAAIWTDVSNAPGAELDSWNLSTTSSTGTCCSLVSITGITGLSLTGGQEYFLVLSPLSLTDDSWNAWDKNNQGVDGLFLSSTNGGSTWTGGGTINLLGAFDVLGDPSTVPEPGSWLMLAAGIGMIAMRARYIRRRSRSQAL